MARKVQNSKKKGNAFQNVIAKMLTEITAEEWKSVPASGALRWKGSHWTFGDIAPPEGVYVTIECKHHARINIDQLVFKNYNERADTKLFLSFWEQSVTDSIRAAEALHRTVTPILVFKRDRGRPVAVVRYDDYIAAAGRAGYPTITPIMELLIEKEHLVFADAELLFNAISPTYFSP